MTAIVAGDIKRYRSAVNNDTNSNGGRMTAAEVVDLTGYLWPEAEDAERLAGSTKWRKLHHKVANADNKTLTSSKLILNKPLPGDDRIYLAIGTATDVQGGLSNPALYGAGILHTGVNANATSLVVEVENGAVVIFRDADTIRIHDANQGEWATISGTPSVNGNLVTITLAAGTANAYSATTSWVSSAIVIGDIASTITTPVVTSSAGTVTAAQFLPNNIGAVAQNLTFTFSSSSAFTCTGDTLGTIGTGNISGTFAPTNPDWSVPYFSLPAAFWGGTWAANDTVTMTLSPAAVAVWEKHVIPAGAASISASDNIRELILYGQSA
jgi:hypothetical protein